MATPENDKLFRAVHSTELYNFFLLKTQWTFQCQSKLYMCVLMINLNCLKLEILHNDCPNLYSFKAYVVYIFWQSCSLDFWTLFGWVWSTQKSLILHNLYFLYSYSNSLHDFQKFLSTMDSTVILKNKKDKIWNVSSPLFVSFKNNYVLLFQGHHSTSRRVKNCETPSILRSLETVSRTFQQLYFDESITPLLIS